MTNSKTTKRALVSSALAVFMCVAMLIGTTFAWFTDTASTSVNKIQAGTLKVDIISADTDESIVNQGLQFVAADEKKGENILWEPNATFKTEGFRIANKGNLALKYAFVLNGVTGDAELLDVIEFSVVKSDGTAVELDKFVGNLKAGEIGKDILYIQGHMKAEAGNKYQGKELTGLGITVFATQDNVEYDSTTNKYDEEATYAKPVSNETELLSALGNGGSVVLTNDVNLSTCVDKVENGKKDSKERKATYIENDVDINLNGMTLNLDSNNILMTTNGATVTISNGTITGNCNNLVWASNGSDLTLTNCVIDASTSGHGVYARRAEGDTGEYSKVTLNDCIINAKESCVGAMNGGIVVINGGTYTSADNYVVGTNGTDNYSGNEITINGGTFNGSIVTSGYIACGVYMAHKGDVITINAGTFNITNGVGLCARYGEATVSNGVFWKVTGEDTNTGKVGSTGPYHAGYIYDGVDGTVNGEKNYK